MTNHAELLFETDRVRGINDVDIATTRDDDADITLSPEDSTISVGGGGAQSGGQLLVRDSDETMRALVTDDSGSGNFIVTNPESDGGIALDGSTTNPGIQSFAGPGITATVENTGSGGRVTVHGPTLPSAPVVEAQAEFGTRFNSPGGTVTVRDSAGETTGIFDGRDGAMVVRGGPESGPDGGGAEPVYGGGDLVIGSRGSPRDLHVHVRGEFDSEYGVDENNRPTIHFDGPNGTVELGRDGLGSQRGGANGSLTIRDANGGDVMGFRATSDGGSEVTFHMSSGGSSVRRGKIEAHPDGLMISMNHPDEPPDQWYHTLLVTKQGDVVTRHPIQENVTL